MAPKQFLIRHNRFNSPKSWKTSCYSFYLGDSAFWGLNCMTLLVRFQKLSLNLFKVVLATTLLGHIAFANQNTTAKTMTTTAKIPAKEVVKAFGLLLDLSYNSNMYAEDDINQTKYSNLTIIPSYKITDRLTTSLRSDITKHFTQDENTEMTNTRMRLSYLTAQLTDLISWSNRFDVWIPTNRKSQLTDRLTTATGIGTSLKYASDVTMATLGLGFTRNYHQYDYTTTGEQLNESTATQALALEFALIDKLSLSVEGTYIMARTYQNTSKYAFETAVGLGYQITKNFSASVGLSNGGSALKANGVDSNIEFLNEKTSELSAGIGYTY